MEKKIKPSAKQLAASLRMTLAIVLLGVLMLVTLTGMNHGGSSVAQDEQPTLTLTATPANLPWTARIFPEPTNPIDQTNGIIIAGGVIVLIILGGTIGATRHKH
jgi:hypothetical protein